MKNLITILLFALSSATLSAQDEQDYMYQTVYLVIADTSMDYYDLRIEMLNLSEKLQIKIDTMDRGYDPSNKLICLPIDHEDEIYAGSYFPRRYSSETLSIEHLTYYTEGGMPNGGKTMALVVAIKGNRDEALETLERVKIYMDQPYILEAKIYMGCMH